MVIRRGILKMELTENEHTTSPTVKVMIMGSTQSQPYGPCYWHLGKPDCRVSLRPLIGRSWIGCGSGNCASPFCTKLYVQYRACVYLDDFLGNVDPPRQVLSIFGLPSRVEQMSDKSYSQHQGVHFLIKTGRLS